MPAFPILVNRARYEQATPIFLTHLLLSSTIYVISLLKMPTLMILNYFVFLIDAQILHADAK
jgi:hypothetical protein